MTKLLTSNFKSIDCPHSEGKYGTGDLKVVMASKIHFTFLQLATDIKPCLSMPLGLTKSCIYKDHSPLAIA